MHVTELNDDELWELKDVLYWNPDAEEMTDEQREEVDNAETQDEISNELVYDVFGKYDFCVSDFLCNGLGIVCIEG